MDKKIALVDMDGCIARWDDSMIPALQSMESPQEAGLYDYSDIWPLQDNHPHIRQRAKFVMSKQGFWTGLKPYEAGIQLYWHLSRNFTTYIVTKALRYCSLAWKEKVDWLHKYIGNDIHIMVVTDKKLVMGDILFDDLPENGHEWLVNNPNGRVIMPKRRYNFNRINGENRIHLWDDSPIKKKMQHVSDFSETIYDFSVPHKVIEEVLKS